MKNGNGVRGAPSDNGNGNRRSGGGLLKLLHPGIGVKRWLALGSLGIAAWSVGIAFLSRRVFEVNFPEFLPANYEGVLLVVAGIAVLVAGAVGLYHSIGPLILGSQNIDSLANTIYTRRSRERGPRIVAIGGGTGLSVLLRGIKAHTDNLTAIITVSDDGGSSGRLRRELGVLPPGDFRNCLVAMSERESVLTDLFQYRFDQGNGLKGHSFGNLFIVAMTSVTSGFEAALYESSRVLAVHGQIVPATIANLTLSARLTDGQTVFGESTITERGGEIEQLFIDPPDAEASPWAVEAIEEADVVVMGPGSLYTSILPNLLVSGISQALRRTKARKIYVCNVATQEGETSGYAVSDHVEALQRHTFPTVANFVVANNNPIELGTRFLGKPVLHDGRPLRHVKLAHGDLIDPEHPVRHDSDRLAAIIMDVYHGRRQEQEAARLPVTL